MPSKESKIIQKIRTMNYPDFVAFIGQKNTPPGAQKTVKRWLEQGNIDQDSHVLDIACSTGFSSRLTVKLTGCRAHGVDLSKKAISLAAAEAEKEGLSSQLKYFVGDVSDLNFRKNTFSHVLGGCNFSFIQARQRALAEVARVLKTGGILCVSNFYYTTPPPSSLLDKVEQAIHFRPNVEWTSDFWHGFLSKKFRLIDEENHTLPHVNEDELKKTIRDSIFQESWPLQDFSDQVKEACWQRLTAIRLILNEHRKYQQYSVEVWRT